MSLIKRLNFTFAAICLCMSIGVAAASPHRTTTSQPGVGQHNTASHVATQTQAGEQVDINTADTETLATLKGIGNKKAAAIVAYRDQNGAFTSVNDLANVRGIGTKAIARLEQNNPGRIVVSQQ